MFTTTSPIVCRTGLHIRPVASGIRLADNEEAVAFKLREVLWREGELGVVVIRLADLPEQLAVRREGGNRCQQHERWQVFEQVFVHKFFVRGWFKVISRRGAFPASGQNVS